MIECFLSSSLNTLPLKYQVISGVGDPVAIQSILRVRSGDTIHTSGSCISGLAAYRKC